ncbi:unnamed protein product [Allacma fusca]|uniref:Uncharacterized protein n=1 Tax=Allacma fusca TaxID=39272 RepID=A0A8J2KLP8_9HEXA|nr:unnamed protein product [Allacma fusca]
MILRKRHWVITCFQVFLPVVLVLGYVLGNKPEQRDGQGSRRMGVIASHSRAVSAPMTEMNIAAIELNFTRVAYVPSNAFTDKVIQNVAESIRALNLGPIVIGISCA